jgi:hypothetical protein
LVELVALVDVVVAVVFDIAPFDMSVVFDVVVVVEFELELSAGFEQAPSDRAASAPATSMVVRMVMARIPLRS